MDAYGAAALTTPAECTTTSMDAAKRACSSSDSPNFRCVASPAMTRTRESKVFESAFSSSRARAVPAMEPSRTRQNNTASGAIRAKISRIRHRPRSPVAPVRKTPSPVPAMEPFSTAPASSRLRHFQTLPDASKPPARPTSRPQSRSPPRSLREHTRGRESAAGAIGRGPVHRRRDSPRRIRRDDVRGCHPIPPANVVQRTQSG